MIYSYFTPESILYPYDNRKQFSCKQRLAVHQKKIEDGWVDSNTPPPGFRLNDQVQAIVNTVLVSDFRAQIYEVNT